MHCSDPPPGIDPTEWAHVVALLPELAGTVLDTSPGRSHHGLYGDGVTLLDGSTTTTPCEAPPAVIVSIGALAESPTPAVLVASMHDQLDADGVVVFVEPTATPRPGHPMQAAWGLMVPKMPNRLIDVTGTFWAHGLTVIEMHRFERRDRLGQRQAMVAGRARKTRAARQHD